MPEDTSRRPLWFDTYWTYERHMHVSYNTTACAWVSEPYYDYGDFCVAVREAARSSRSVYPEEFVVWRWESDGNYSYRVRESSVTSHEFQ